MTQSIQSLIAASVNGVLREQYPTQYSSLCHAHAIVGANLISIVLDRVYRPVAGLALIDCGGGQFIELLDNDAFGRPEGGAFHCWIESADPALTEREIVDLTFRHNHEYAANNGYVWTAPPPPPYLWGPAARLLVPGRLGSLPACFPAGTLWLQETDAGFDWIMRHAAENMNAYVVLTAQALQKLKAALPPDSTLLEPLLPPREVTGSARASVPVQA